MTPPVLEMTMSARHAARQRRFETLLLPVLPALRRHANYLCHHRGSPDDLVQETLLRAWRALDSLREDAAAHSWFMTILRNEFMRQWTKLRRTVNIEALEVADIRTIHGDAYAELRDIYRALGKLAPKYAQPLVMQTRGCNTREIARSLGLTQRTVLTRLFRARNKLRYLLGLNVA